MKAVWKDYFAFNKSQKSGILVLVFLIAGMIVYLLISDYLPISEKPADFSSFKAGLDKAGISPQPAVEAQKFASLHIDLNTADTGLLMRLPNMTASCAAIIVRYRKKLGGFYNPSQLMEVKSMDSALFKAIAGKVWADTMLIQKLSINNADDKQLARHPYIHKKLAQAIIAYREKNGIFHSLSALHNIEEIDDSKYAQIAPYLKL